MRRRLIKSCCGWVLALVIGSCGWQESGPHSGDSSFLEGLNRSSQETWERRTYPSLGLNVDIPTDICWESSLPGGEKKLHFHSFPPPNRFFGDTQCLLKVTFKLMSDADILAEEEYVSRLSAQAPSRPLWEWRAADHPTISRMQGPIRSFYRYDVPCPDGAVIWIGAEVIHPTANGKPQFVFEDDRLVRRILESSKCSKLRSILDTAARSAADH